MGWEYQYFMRRIFKFGVWWWDIPFLIHQRLVTLASCMKRSETILFVEEGWPKFFWIPLKHNVFPPFFDSKNMWYSPFWDKPQQQEYLHSGMRIEYTRCELIWLGLAPNQAVQSLGSLTSWTSLVICRLPASAWDYLQVTEFLVEWVHCAGDLKIASQNWCVCFDSQHPFRIF